MPLKFLCSKISIAFSNLNWKQNFKRVSSLLSRFCDFTSIGGFRYFTAQTPYHIRLPAIIVFNLSLALLIYQLVYLINQYAQNAQTTTTTILKSSTGPLPHIFICPSLINQTKFPLFEEYQSSINGSLPNNEILDQCLVKIDERLIGCDVVVEKTLIGICYHISYNFTDIQKFGINPIAVKHFYLRLYYNITTNPKINLYLVPFNEKNLNNGFDILFTGIKPPIAMLRPHILTFIQINELFRVSGGFNFDTYDIVVNVKGKPTMIDDYLSCIGYLYDAEISLSRCKERVLVSMRETFENSSITSIFANTPCSVKALTKARKGCSVLKPNANFYRVDVSALSKFREPNINFRSTITPGNIIITFRGMQKRTTVYARKTEIWKLISDIGGTFSLYTGFTFLSILETIAFFSSSRLRKSAAQDEQTLMERKNPPIKFPFQLKFINLGIQKLCNFGKLLFNKLKKSENKE